MPTWILRDADDNVVPALVSPLCGHEDSTAGSCPAADPGGDHPFNCVMVSVLDGAYWNVGYRLSNGSAVDCKEERTWTDPPSNVLYFEANCAGEPYTNRSGIVSAENVEGELWYGTPSLPTVAIEDSEPASWVRDGVCESINYAGPTVFTQMIEVPDSVYSALDNPPYTIEIEQ